jgi:hypothetical protein
MKWNEIRNNFQKSITTISTIPEKVRSNNERSSGQDVPAEHHKNNLFIGGIFLVIIIACIIIFSIIIISRKTPQSETINPEQAIFIENFLDENPPEPMTPDQESAIQQLLEINL